MQAKDLWHVIIWEVSEDVILHMLNCLEEDRHEVVSGLALYRLCRYEVLLWLIFVDLLDGKIVELLGERYLVYFCLNTMLHQAGLIHDILIDEVPHCMRQDIFVLLIDQLAAVV